MLFLPFSHGQLAMTKPLIGPKEPKVGNAKGLNFLRSHPRVWKINITHTMHLTSMQRTQDEDSGEKPFEEERDLVAKNYDLKQKLLLSKFGLERFGSNDDDIFFYTGFQSYRAFMAFWNFIKPCSGSLMSWNTARRKVKESSANNANLFPFLQGQEKQRNRKREIEPIDQL